jgi:ribonuclease HI
MAKNKFYVVWKGRQMGIFDSWESCKEQVFGYEGAQYKGYPTEIAAQEAFATNYWKVVNPKRSQQTMMVKGEIKPTIPSLAVDAACSGNPGKMEYRGVETSSGQEIFRQGPFELGTNNIGEFLAIVHGLAFLKKQNSNLPLYSDSVNALAWVKAKHCKTKLERCAKNEVLFELIERAETWLKQNSYETRLLKWQTTEWGEIPADFGRK